MEFFNKAKAVRLRSYHDKYLVADENEETVRQSRNGTSRCARWTVEFIPGHSHLILLKSCYGTYLTASEEPFLLGMTGKKVVQTMSTSKKNTTTEWEPLTTGYQVKLRTRGGKFLRANGGTPPWRNSVTHDVPHRTSTQDWVLWNVDVLDILEFDSIPDYISPATSFSSSFSYDFRGSKSWNSSFSFASDLSTQEDVTQQSAMEFFQRAKSVRLRSHHDKYLLADEDQENVSQDRHGTIRNAKWTVEIVDKANVVRLKSCYGKYLTASNMPFLLGMQGKKVTQTLPRRLDSSIEWEPSREGVQVRLKTRYGQYLRANGGIPPWRNSITHDIPYRTSTQDWVLWDVDVIEIRNEDPSPSPPPPQPRPPTRQFEVSTSEPNSPRSSVSSSTVSSPKFSRIDSDDSFVGVPVKNEGRIIYYRVANEHGDIKENEELSFNFKGSVVEELKRKLEEETGMNDTLVCFLNPLNGKLYPLRLHLPPNNANMHVVVVPSSGRGASNIMHLVDPPARSTP
ncbi:hypothetical protein K2173_014166 [Erythroxylum novogranatense]|uniref:Actin cross-linking n=1 Tax=Erythroxylum novogranatense TaxID=1862640 RepID=A0AAV8SDE4_9ROSI|nr:hypothetical protein K2173_014166 [Erythroxylum novogranatense]